MSRNTLLGLVYRLAREAEKGGQRIRGFERITAMDAGVTFKDGIPVEQAINTQQRAA